MYILLHIKKKLIHTLFCLFLKLLKAFSVSLIRKIRWKDCSRVLHFWGKIKIRGMLLKQYLNLAWMILKLRNNLLPMLSRPIGMVACSIKDYKNNNRRNKLKRIMAFVTKFVQQWKKKINRDTLNNDVISKTTNGSRWKNCANGSWRKIFLELQS